VDNANRGKEGGKGKLSGLRSFNHFAACTGRSGWGKKKERKEERGEEEEIRLANGGGGPSVTLPSLHFVNRECSWRVR